MTKTREELKAYAFERKEVYSGEADVLRNDCDTLVYLFENCEITISDENRFFVRVNCEDIQREVFRARAEKYRDQVAKEGYADGEEVLAYTGEFDFGHTSPEWESILSLGIYGLRMRAENYLKTCADRKKQRFYGQIVRVYDAALLFLKRAADEAESAGRKEMAQGLYNLLENPPKTMYEAMQTTLIYYALQHHFDGTYLRTLGRLDTLLYPYFVKTEPEETKALFIDYLKEINSYEAEANMPFAIGGTDADGNSLVNELSYLFLDAYTKLSPPNVKLHLLCSSDIPEKIVKEALIAVRNGNNSIVFLSDGKVIESLEKLGAEHTDAANYHVVGCYECGANNEITCSCNARVNLPKALELALNGGKDAMTGKLIGPENDGVFDTFEALYQEFLRQMTHLSNCAMRVTDIYEENYRNMHAGPIFSSTYTSAMESGGDIYCDYAAKYNNSSVNALGLATAVDSLAAIQKLVFEEKKVTLDKLKEIIKTNWENEEVLRLTAKNKLPKYGTGDVKADAIAKDVVDVLASVISGRPNKKGGVYRLGLFSINWRWEFGEKTAASFDGRKNGESISQNTSATFGADKEGATAHLLSAAKIDTTNTPNGSVVDIDLHASSVQGENGLNALYGALKAYFELGGFAVQYNVLNTEVLKDAQKNPDKYRNLQVRLCGWNVLFSSLTEKEQNEFIARSSR